MKDIIGIFRRKTNCIRTPLLDTTDDGHTQEDNDQDVGGNNNTLDQNTLSIHKAHVQLPEEVMLQDLAELLRAPLGADSLDTSEDGWSFSEQPEPNSGQQHLKPYAFRLIQRSASQHFPKAPADVDQSLQQHLWDMQNTMFSEFMRLRPALEPMGLMGCLINCYHRETIDHLDHLLKHITSFNSSFDLMKWGLKTYLSQELLGHPDLSRAEPITSADLLLLCEWGVKAKEKLLEEAQKYIRELLEKILLHDKEQTGSDRDEAYVRLYVDTIGCIAPIPSRAQSISPELSDKLKEVCFQELHKFVRRYQDEQHELLKKTAKEDEPEMMHFFKTLKTCQELKSYVETEGIRSSLHGDILDTLENITDLTLKLLRDIATNMAKTHLKLYFRAANKQFFFLITALKRVFPPLENSEDVRQTVMDEVYGIVVQSYIEHLIKGKPKKLEKCWSLEVGQIVSQDADLLHDTMSDLVPGVQGWNSKLKKVQEVLDCKDRDALKLTVAQMHKQSLQPSEDLQLLHRLLRWKGLSTRDVREVLDAIPDHSWPRPVSGACCSFLCCC